MPTPSFSLARTFITALVLFLTAILTHYVVVRIASDSRNSFRFGDEYGEWFPILSNEQTNELFSRRTHAKNVTVPNNFNVKPWSYFEGTYCAARKEQKKNQNRSISGLLYVKIPKAASTTLAGVALRIGYRRSPHETMGCHVEACHGEAWKGRKNYINRTIGESFLFSFIRNPSSRSLSQAHHFHLNIEHDNLKASDDEIKIALNRTLSDHKFGYQLFYLELNQSKVEMNVVDDPIEEAVNRIMNDYDFIGLVERFDESLVVMRILLGLDAADILYIRSKDARLSKDGMSYDHICRPIASYEVSSEIKNYLKSEEWLRTQRGDLALYDAVSNRLDATIDNVIGRDVFDAAMAQHMNLLELARNQCDMVIFPCQGGNAQFLSHRECYLHDSGCGFWCLDGLKGTELPAGGMKQYARRLVSTKYCHLGCAAEHNCGVDNQVHGGERPWNNIILPFSRTSR